MTTQASAATASLGDLVQQTPRLLSGTAGPLLDWVKNVNRSRMVVCLAAIVVGAGLFGAAMGWWRAPLQAVYAAIKLPLLILLTTLGNALLNGLLAPLLGLNIGFRQTALIILLGFVMAATILGAFAPIVWFVVCNVPSGQSLEILTSPAYHFMQLTLVLCIVFAGITANWKLLPLLERLSGNARVAKKVLFAWLAANLLLGSQLCWILRPFIWDPTRPVEFLGQHPMQGSFYETVFEAVRQIVVNL
jgi:hypothetical protein